MSESCWAFPWQKCQQDRVLMVLAVHGAELGLSLKLGKQGG